MKNQNFFEQRSEFEKYLLIAYLLTVLISSIVGDTIILIASTRYNALKLNKFILTIIHHISICDLITDISNVLPILTAVWADGWILGDISTKIGAVLANWSFSQSNILVVILTCSKFLLVKFPQKTRNWSEKKAHIACGVAWLAVLPFSLQFVSPGELGELLLKYHTGTASNAELTLAGWKSWSSFDNILAQSCLFISVGTTFLVILFSLLTLKLLFEARQLSRRSRGSLRWQGIVTVVLTGTVFSVSTLPYCIYIMTSSIFSLSYIFRYLQFLAFLNTSSNFFIYCLTIKSFREFLISKISLIKSKFLCSDRMLTEHSCSRNAPVIVPQELPVVASLRNLNNNMPGL